MSRMSRAVGARAASARAGEFVSTTFTGADGRSKWAPLFPADHDLSYKVFPLLGPKGSAFARGATTAVDPTRVRPLNAMEDKLRGPVMYWMSRDQRANDNWALLYAQSQAIARRAPLVIAFNLVPKFLEGTIRQFGFMLKGLAQVEAALSEKGIPFVLLRGDPVDTVTTLASTGGFSLIVCDFSPLRIGVQWRRAVAAAVSCPVHEVDAHNVVPVWTASTGLENGAYSIRPKLKATVAKYFTEFPPLEPHPVVWERPAAYTGSINWSEVADTLVVDRTVPEVDWCPPGELGAWDMLQRFIARMERYDVNRNDVTLRAEASSGLSPYLHFGQLAPQRAAIEVFKHRATLQHESNEFLEQVIIRRELADNYCFYNPGYDNFDTLFPQNDNKSWAQQTLRAHMHDRRPYYYTEEQLEAAATHDKLWNAAQREMVYRGKMHCYMRMYWAKMILLWTPTPMEALRIAIKLNDKYQLDGRDPNGYVGCAWSIAGVHDKAYNEFPVFGRLRTMTYEGCKKKFSVMAYISRIDDMCAAVTSAASAGAGK